MAIVVSLLEDSDVLKPTDWVRPLEVEYNEFGNSFTNSFNTYGGGPINHLKWVIASDILGKVWMGKSIAELRKEFERIGGFNFEVVRGDIPKDHVWDWREERTASE